MTHTNEFLTGMFAAYMGCEVINTDEGKHLKMIAISGYFISVYEPPYPFCESEGDEYEWMFSECKLILAPLSEISDEDAVEVGRIVSGNNPEFDDTQNAVMGKVVAFAFAYGAGLDFPVSAVLNCTDYLRSKHYDCGYMHIPSLITAGLAIKKTT